MTPVKGWRKPRVLGCDDPMGFVAFMQRYHEWMRTNHYAAYSIRTSRDSLWRFFEWCHERDIAEPREVTRAIIERYQRWLFHYRIPRTGKHLGVATQCNLLTQVRIFLSWLTRNQFLLHNPASELQLPRQEQRLPRQVLQAAEVEDVLNQADTGKPLGLRDRAMMELFYATGIRRTELVNLDLTDLNLAAETLLIREGKGGKDRLLPVGRRALAWLDKYLLEVRPLLAPAGEDAATSGARSGAPLFLSGEKRRFHPGSVGHLLKKYFRAAGIEGRGVCHVFRHSMATLMLENGADIRVIQEMLGHENLNATKIYTKVSIKQLQEVHRRTHPAHRHRAAGAEAVGTTASERNASSDAYEADGTSSVEIDDADTGCIDNASGIDDGGDTSDSRNARNPTPPPSSAE